MRMSPEERREFKGIMRQRSGGQLDVESDDPRDLARTVAQAQQQGGSGGLLSFLGFGDEIGPAAATGGVPQYYGGRSLFDTPIVKAVLAGIAAIVFMKFMDREHRERSASGSAQAWEPPTKDPPIVAPGRPTRPKPPEPKLR